MEGDIRVRRLTPDDATHYRAIRLEALEREPDAFLATLDEEARQPMTFFAERLATSAVFGAFQGDGLIGMAGFYRPEGKGTLWGMYVRRSARRSGLGQALTHAVLAHAATQVPALELIVVESNLAAVRFYRALGFVHAGSAPRAKQSGRHDDEIVMRMILPTRPAC